jgi:hypothetical protein
VERCEEINKPDDVRIATGIVFKALNETLREAECEEPNDEDFGCRPRRRLGEARWCGWYAHNIWCR